MLHPRAPATVPPSDPVDAQLLEAVEWLEAVVVAAHSQGATPGALALAQERVHGVEGHLACLLADGVPHRAKHKLRREPKASAKASAKRRRGAPAQRPARPSSSRSSRRSLGAAASTLQSPLVSAEAPAIVDHPLVTDGYEEPPDDKDHVGNPYVI